MDRKSFQTTSWPSRLNGVRVRQISSSGSERRANALTTDCYEKATPKYGAQQKHTSSTRRHTGKPR